MKIGIGLGISRWRKSSTYAPPAAPTVSGTISNQSVQQGTGIVTYSTAGAFTGSSLTYSLTGGGAGITINPATGVVSVDRAVVVVNVFSLTVRATNVSGFAQTGFTLTVTEASAGLAYGFDPNLDLGTDGNYFVDAIAGSNANPGTSFGAAKQTIAAAMALATAGQKVRVIGNGVNYRETITAKTGVAVLGYGTHKPVLNAGEVLTGWVQCTGADAAVLGSVTPSNVWKRTGLTKSLITGSDPFGLNLVEADEKLPMARTQEAFAPLPQFMGNPDNWIDGATLLSGSDIIGWTLPASYSDLTTTQVMGGMVRFVCQPNINNTDVPASYNSATRQIGATNLTRQYESNAKKDKIMVMNILPRIKKGQYGFVDNGSTVDVYCYPNNTANLTSGMQFARRDNIIDLNTAVNFEFAGFVLANASSASTSATDGGHAISTTSGTPRSGGILRNLKIQNTERFRGGYGAIDIKSLDDLTITGCEIVNAVGQLGIFLRGNSSPTTNAETGFFGQGWVPMTGALISNNLIRLTDAGPLRFYTCRNFASVRNVFGNNGDQTHSNKVASYEQCHNMLFLFNRWRGANGYITWQEASDIVIIGNDLTVSYKADGSGNEGRGIEDQNSNNFNKPAPSRFDPPYIPTVQGSFCFNNRVAPYDQFGPAENRSLKIGSTETTVFFYGYNNIVNGTANIPPEQINAFDRNFYTNGVGVAGFDANSQFSTVAATYVDASIANLSIAPASTVRSMSAQNMASTITALSARFPQVSDWATDLAGNAINWTSPPIGPYADYSNYGTFPAQRIRWPEINGASFVGETLTFDTGWVEVDPWPGQATQLQLSSDQITWVDKVGATGPTYVIQAEDAAKYPRIRVTTGADVAYSTPGGLIGSSYPISEPVVLGTMGSPTSGTQYETSTVSVTGKPVMVFVFNRLTSSVDTNQAVTIGASGRAFGTGTSIPQVSLGRRTSSQMTAHFIANPGTGSLSVQTTSAASVNSCRIVTVEIGGAAGIGALANIGATGFSATPTVTTTALNSIIMYAGYKPNSVGESLSATGATEINVGSTGGTDSLNAICFVGWELAPTASSYDCTITAVNNSTIGTSAIVITS